MRDDLWTPHVYDWAKELWAKGMSSSQIAGVIGHGMTRAAVNAKAFRHRNDFPKRPPQVPKRAAITGPAPVVDNGAGRVWTERKFGECAFPVGGVGADTRSCCAATTGVYCDHHQEVMYVRA
jgi:hypothetical protein